MDIGCAGGDTTVLIDRLGSWMSEPKGLGRIVDMPQALVEGCHSGRIPEQTSALRPSQAMGALVEYFLLKAPIPCSGIR